MNVPARKTDLLFEEVVKTTNDNRIKLIEDAIQCFDLNDIKVSIDHYEFYLILDEAVSNAMEHGNRWVVDKLVKMKILQPFSGQIEIYIEDEGNGFNPENIPKSNGSIHTLSPRGRGIIIMKKFCDVLWNDKGNGIRLILSIQQLNSEKK